MQKEIRYGKDHLILQPRGFLTQVKTLTVNNLLQTLCFSNLSKALYLNAGMAQGLKI